MATHERSDRIRRLEALRTAGVDPYPARTKRTRTTTQVHASFGAFMEEQAVLVLVGRIRAIREHGKSAFVALEDGHGRLQIYVKRDNVGEEAFANFQLADVGDFIEVHGVCFRTKTGEETLEARHVVFLTKALRPLPEKWHGLTDTETRYRHRELDLLANPEVRAAIEWRAAIVNAVRSFFVARGYLEVETPILQPIPGGATAAPFVTHHHALDQDLYLRVAPELYLKRLLVGGFERVFEMARCFRNEGIDRNHNPEFTQVEAYEAYASYEDYMELIEALFLELSTNVLKTESVTFAGDEIRIVPPFPRRPFRDLVLDASGIDIAQVDDDALRDVLARLGVKPDRLWGRAKLLDELYKETARPKLVQPTFVMNHPVELSPLSKRRVEDPSTVERFQLVIAGAEVVNAFSELNDPLDQRERFEAQQRDFDAGDVEAMRLDEDFLSALEVGMPPTAGLGIGIDRLAMILTGSSNLKEVIAFPTLRKKE